MDSRFRGNDTVMSVFICQNSIKIETPSEAVFALIHDYDQRLECDTMLSKAAIRHAALSSNRSRLTYTYLFRARPKFLSVVLEPLINWALRRETRGRLHALQGFMTRQQRQNNL